MRILGKNVLASAPNTDSGAMRKCCVLVIFMLTAACSTIPEQKPEASDAPKKPKAAAKRPAKKAFNVSQYDIDYQNLQNYLKLSRRKSQLGFETQSFNSCKVGYGFPKSEPCYDLHMSVIHIRLQCRASEGTTSEVQTNYNVDPIANEKITWTINRDTASVETDSEGYAQIYAITEPSANNARLKISNGKDFLYMRAKDISRVVTPSNWCH